jgi:ferritin-like metal-binding protein YciE
MEKMQDLTALLKHEIQDIYSAEEQIIEALPMMIENATNPKLKRSLQDHLKVTRQQVKRLDRVQQLMKVDESEKGRGKQSGLFGLFGKAKKCKAMEGILAEGNSIMGEDMNEEVKDAAIIAACQKVEHYEICSYGTVKAYANQLGLKEVTRLLDETLSEEYEADDLLTELALVEVNEEAEISGAESRTNGRTEMKNGATERGSSSRSSSSSPARSTGKSSSGSKSNSSNGRSSSSNGKASSGRSNGTTAKKSSSSTISKSSTSKAKSSSLKKKATAR